MTIENGAGPTAQAVSDEMAIERVRSGDGASFELIMRRHNQRLYRIARGILRNASEAEDAVQEAYVRAFENLAAYQGKGTFSAWLARIAVNESLGRLRQPAHRHDHISLDAPQREDEATVMSKLTFSGPSPEEHAALRDFRQVLESAIDALPDVYRMVFVFRGVVELSVAETADLLNIPAATVKSRYHRARKMLQQHLSGMMDVTAAETFPFAGQRCDRIVAGVFKRLNIEYYSKENTI